jgi:uncharacterized membrane protein YhaH (DUF805 family)
MGAGGGLSSLSTSTISSARRCDRWSKALEVLLSTAKGQAWRLTGSAGVLLERALIRSRCGLMPRKPCPKDPSSCPDSPSHPMPRPYQPSLLRLLHGTTALLVPLAWLTGLLVYSADDGRFGRLPFRLPGEWIDIHGTLGVLLWPIALLFAVYALTAGRLRLRQPANALALVALGLAVGSGKLMDENWLRDGQLHHLVYSVHLLAWMLIAFAVILHVAAVLQRGGWPLVRSMASVQLRPGDLPGNWFDQIRRSFRSGR